MWVWSAGCVAAARTAATPLRAARRAGGAAGCECTKRTHTGHSGEAGGVIFHEPRGVATACGWRAAAPRPSGRRARAPRAQLHSTGGCGLGSCWSAAMVGVGKAGVQMRVVCVGAARLAGRGRLRPSAGATSGRECTGVCGAVGLLFPTTWVARVHSRAFQKMLWCSSHVCPGATSTRSATFPGSTHRNVLYSEQDERGYRGRT